MRISRVHTFSAGIAVAVVLLAIAPIVSARAGQPTQPLTGRLSSDTGLPVLELWGTPTQAAYTQGFLCADSIVALFDDYILDPRITPNVAVYEGPLRAAVRRQFTWPPAVEGELSAILNGLIDRLGRDGVRSAKLDRELDVDDLMVANCLADWFGLACSSFSVWGRLTPDGALLTARNLDFPFTTSMQRAQLVVIRRADGLRPAWIGVSWPGLIGVYTALSEAGVSISMHDANGLPASDVLGFTPRSLTLREALEAARPASFIADVCSVLENRRALVGNNIHVSVPVGTSDPPAAIFEYDGSPHERGVSVRRPAHDGGPADQRLYCTNHLRLRQQPRECRRYEVLERTLARRDAAGRPVDVPAAFELLEAVRQDTTLHAVVFEPAARRIHVRIPALTQEVVVFDLSVWLRRPVEGAAAE